MAESTRLSLSELRNIITSAGLQHDDCLERGDLEARAYLARSKLRSIAEAQLMEESKPPARKAKKKKLPVPPRTVATDAQTGSPSLVAVGGGVPDLLGESMAVVLRKAKRAGLQVNLEGSGRSFKQSLPPGTPLPEDKQIIVYFRSPADRAAAAQGGGYAP